MRFPAWFSFPLLTLCVWMVATQPGAALAEEKPAATGEQPTVAKEPLPYPQDALEPVISSSTLGFHHGKHYAGYVDKANELLRGSPLAGKPLVEIVMATAADPAQKALFNNAAQAWNHAFYFRCLKPKAGGKPTGKLAKLIDESFGSFEAFAGKLLEAGKGQFGSGWVWVVLDGDKLQIVATANAETPLTAGKKPVLVLDVWEHAYYLDYQNRRPDYVQSFLDHLVNWDFVAANLAAARR